MMMQKIQQLFETLYDETGIAGRLDVTYDGADWVATIVDTDNHTLLCPAGEFYLSTRADSLADAVQQLEEKVAAGYKLVDACLA